MVQYTISVKIDNERINALNTNMSNLCIGKVVKDASGKEHCNVIATVRTSVQPNMEISWTDEYKILGANIKFQEGVKISGFSEGHEIEFGQTYEINDWTTETVYQDAKVPKGSFGFRNHMICSPLLLMKLDGGFVPVYISAAERGPGTTTITPMPKARIWFQDAAVSSTMSVSYVSDSFPIDLVPNGKAWVQYDKNGNFAAYSPS